MKAITRNLGAFALAAVLALQSAAQNGSNGAPGKAGFNAAVAIAAEAYISPPPEIERLVTAPRHLNTSLSNLSPDGKLFLFSRSGGPPTLAELSKPYYNLGGVRIDYRAQRSRALSMRGAVRLELVDPLTGSMRAIEAPRGSTLSGASWSPDGSKVAFFANFDDATHLYVADVGSGNVRRLTRTPVLATFATNFQWTAANKIGCVLVPDGRGPAPSAPPVPAQPQVQVTRPERNRLRTFPALLKTQHDQEMLEYYTTGQLALLDVGSGAVSKFGKPAMIRSFDFSPDGKYARVTVLDKPFSYLVPVSSFGDKEEIWDQEGKALTELQKRPLRLASGPTDDQAAGQTEQPTSKRSLAWRPDGKGLTYIEQEPTPARGAGAGNRPPSLDDEQGPGRGRFGGGPPGEAAAAQGGPPRKDRVFQWLPPFGKDDAKLIYESDIRINSVAYSADCQTLFMTETRDGASVLFAVDLKEPAKKKVIYSHRSGAESQNNPGSLMTKSGPMGPSVVRISPDGKRVFLQGTETVENDDNAQPRPFLDAYEIETGKKTRLWQSAADVYETVSAVLDDEVTRIVLNRQTRTMVPNNFLAELAPGANGSAGPPALKQLTNNVDFHPEISSAKVERIQVTRADGFKFWVTVTLPKWHIVGVKLPAFFWFYPREYTDQRAYDRSTRSRNPNTFPTFGPSSKQFLITLGYALVEPDCPIVGPQGRMNDFYVPDLRQNMWAVIDALDKKGVIDRDRLAIGGHSYGAFSTANVLIHTPYFKAGIAGDGAFNRLLTPAGFQTEQRVLWEARETYLTMSPLLYAEQMNGALLMYHGMDDQNVGTFPINSERLYHALENLGKPAALYMYPYEDHGPAAIETHLDLWARWVAWLEKYVKNSAGAGAAEAPPAATAPPP